MRFMRETLHGSERVTALFAGSLEHMMRELFTNRQRAFYGFGGFMELTPILAGEWRAGLVERFAEDDCAVEVQALDRIIELGGPHPRAIMLIAQQAHLASIEANIRRIDLGLALSGWQNALQAERAAETADLLTRERREGAAMRRAARVRELALHAWYTHRAGPYGGGGVTLIRSEEFRVQPGLERWHVLDTAGVVERHVRGTHRSMMREPDVESLAACVKRLVDASVEPQPSRTKALAGD